MSCFCFRFFDQKDNEDNKKNLFFRESANELHNSGGLPGSHGVIHISKARAVNFQIFSPKFLFSLQKKRSQYLTLRFCTIECIYLSLTQPTRTRGGVREDNRGDVAVVQESLWLVSEQTLREPPS